MADPRLAGTALAGRYHLLDPLESGGMATVWVARDEVLGRKVAVKILHSHLAADPAFCDRFRLEATAAGALTHPNIVSIYDTGEHLGALFLVMEYLAGGSLAALLAEEGPLDPSRVSVLGAQICEALAYAHSCGVIHRDIKPANILLTESGWPKVADFGIAYAAADADLVTTGEVLGTLRYMPPEILMGGASGPRGDLYSLGVVLFEALCGRPPFEDKDVEVALSSRRRRPRHPRDLRPDVPKGLDAVIVRALAPSPSARFDHAAEMSAALRSITGTSTSPPPVAPAPPTGRIAVLQKPSFFKSEGRWLAPTLGLVLLAVGLILVVLKLPNWIRVAPPRSSSEAKGQSAQIRGGGTYDPPPGDGSEKDSLVPRAFDGNPGTFWRAQSYTRADFGGLKPGVGLWIDLGEATELGGLQVSSPTSGWIGALRHSDDGKRWSEPGPGETAGERHVFSASGKHRYWMIWITKLVPVSGGEGDSRSIEISEVKAFLR
ncbi:MAG: protein kinase domain-containing protein [Actinomycetota bacterium]